MSGASDGARDAPGPTRQEFATARDWPAPALDIVGILQRIPHRYPFVLVDRLLECVPMKSARALKNVSRGEPYFAGLDSGELRMPQLLIIEAMAQTCALLCSFSVPDPANSTYFFAGLENCRFARSVVPGDQLTLEAKVVRMARGYGKYHVCALVSGDLAAEADLIAVVVQGAEAKA